jgi:hypothetical protein
MFPFRREEVVGAAERGDWGPLTHLISLGHWGMTLTLTQVEYTVLWKILSGRLKRRTRRGPPRNREAEFRKHLMGIYSVVLELDGVPRKAAVADTMRLFRAGRSAVYAAREKDPLNCDDPTLTNPVLRQHFRKKIEDGSLWREFKDSMAGAARA